MLIAIGTLRLLRRLVRPEVMLNILFAREYQKRSEDASDSFD